MIFTETKLKGAYIIDLQPIGDERGFFSRAFCAREFSEHGLMTAIAQCNISFNAKEGVVRGLHYQIAPALEVKLVRCVRGAVYDVIVDLRPGSDTYLQHVGLELSAENHRALYVPALFAHGYQTLTGNAEVYYHVSGPYTPDLERGVRFNDPALGINWPRPITEATVKDRSWPLVRVDESSPPVSSS